MVESSYNEQGEDLEEVNDPSIFEKDNEVSMND
jgi:hypothetical protein